MPKDENGLQRLLGKIEERTRDLPEMQKDIGAIKGKLENLPCDEHARKLDHVGEQVDAVRIQAAAERPKMAMLWQILLWVVAALVGFGVSVVLGNGGL